MDFCISFLFSPQTEQLQKDSERCEKESVRARQQEADTKKKHAATQEQLTKELTRAKALFFCSSMLFYRSVHS